ncbi:hypothetical protein CHS0354_025648 [Potamilus streckersoni]|uniref:Carboxylic ester hydrolase n=1 Tax=Potamilus streckersoni TaxID=2493646 RepID=A0AAE0RYL4_9BIVA|nr:hypothetical protein CHS0354_025648 [Potamilus streckersoni]
MEGCILVCLLSVINLFLTYGVEYHTVTSKIGDIIGLKDVVVFGSEKREVLMYLGIPYAQAPKGELRFRRPVMKAPFSSAYNATFHRPACLQLQTESLGKLPEFSEDCLYLNIYAPGAVLKEANGKYAVMIGIHGGAFVQGFSDLYVGDVLSAVGEVVVVTINYRLSVYGFLDAGDENAAGNCAFWDQRLAMQWVHDNIAAFGGNPNLVTVFGQSAGAVSASLHAVYPPNKGLFKRVIAQSGVPTLGVTSTKRNNIGTLALALNCNHTEIKQIIKCLQNKRDTEIRGLFLNSPLFSLQFQPVVDGDFIKQTSISVLKTLSNPESEEAKLFSSLDFLSGVTDKDGIFMLKYFWASMLGISDGWTASDFPVDREKFEKKVVPLIAKQVYGTSSKVIEDAIIFQYTDWKNPESPYNRRDMLVDLSTDYAFLHPSLHLADIHAGYNSSAGTYFYIFSHRPYLDKVTPKWVKGANHGMEIPFVFAFSDRLKPFLSIPKETTVPADEFLLGKYIITKWTNFAKTGNPNEPVQLPIHWPEYKKGTRDYFLLNANLTSTSIKQRPEEIRMAFWDRLIFSLSHYVSKYSAVRQCKEKQCPSDKPRLKRFDMELTTAEDVLIALIIISIIILIVVVILITYILFARWHQN